MIVSNTDSLKRANRARVMKEIFDSGPISRKQISANLSLTPATVTNIANFLLKNRLIEEVGVQKEKRSGPRAILLKVSQNQYYICAVHIGRNVLKLGIVTLSGEICSYRFSSIQNHSAQDIEKMILAYVTQVRQEQSLTILGVGVCVSGNVSSEEKIISALYPDLNGYPLKENLEQQLEIPVVLDGLLPAMAEESILFSRNDLPKSSIIIYDGAFLALSCTYGSLVLRGSNDLAGAMYQCQMADGISLEDEICIPQIIKKNFLHQVTNSLLDTDDIDIEQLSAYWQKIMLSYTSGDPLAKVVIDRRNEAFAQLLARVTVLFDPESILIKSVYSTPGNESSDLSHILTVYHQYFQQLSRPLPNISFEVMHREFSIRSSAAIILRDILSMGSHLDNFWSDSL